MCCEFLGLEALEEITREAVKIPGFYSHDQGTDRELKWEGHHPGT